MAKAEFNVTKVYLGAGDSIEIEYEYRTEDPGPYYKNAEDGRLKIEMPRMGKPVITVLNGKKPIIVS